MCGHVRYRLTARPGAILHCHCTDCRASSGAAFLSWAEVPLDRFQWTGAEPGVYAHESDSAPRVERTFCPRCGTALTFQRSADKAIDVTLASLDDTTGLTPEAHLFVSSAVDWVTLADELPRHPRLRSTDS